MMLDELSTLFERDLKKLVGQIALYQSEEELWLKSSGISNSAGNLALHIIGNLNHFIGAILGETGYVRNREFEFGDERVLRSQIVSDTLATIEVVNSVLSKLEDDELEKAFPIEVFGEPMTTGFFLMHLHSHLNYHLGQINYHRRILSHSKS